MTVTRSPDWRYELGLADLKPPVFYSSESEVKEKATAVPQALALQRAFVRLNLNGILCLENNPLAYFKEVTTIRPADVLKLHRQFWNQGLAPILVLIDSREIHVYSGLTFPAEKPEDLERNNLVERLNRVADEAKVRQLVLAISSGAYFRNHAKLFDPKQRVDRNLLSNLQATREALGAATSRRLGTQTLDALLCRLVFVCYLFDRHVIGSAYLSSIGIPTTNHLREILSRPKQEARDWLYALFKKLGTDFNGDLFSDNLDQEARTIAVKHLEILDQFLSGTNMTTGQRSFWPYDFAMIPIETISAIYEHFLQTEDPEGKRRAGAFYTPRFLAEVTLDIAFDGMDSLLDKRFLDPACGSGIFLVGVFNRLAEEWKRLNPNARYDRQANSLIEILRHNLSGVDINPTACRISAFSLYLALLDQLSPPDIQRLQGKGKMLPRLVCFPKDCVDQGQGQTIRCEDFFAGQSFGEFDLVVGNPPWKSLDGPVTGAEKWCQDHHAPIPNRQLAIAFVWKGARHQRADGRVCLVLPHGVLFNHQERAIAFQKAWLEQCSLDLVLNLADMRFNLFEAAVGPALVVRYRTCASLDTDQRIQYLAPKTSWAISQAEIVSIPPEDRSEIPAKNLLSDLNAHRAPRAWKERFWGTPRDWKFLDRLYDLPPLSEVVGGERSAKPPRWIIAEGFQPVGISDNSDDAKSIKLPTRLFLPAKGLGARFVLSESDCEKLPQPKFVVRKRSNTSTTVFNPPHVLVSKGLNVAFADFAVAFRHAIRGIQGPVDDRKLLLFLTAYLRSPLARYFLFHTSSRWGIERAEVEVAELLRVPFPLPEQTSTPDQAKRLVHEVAQKVDAFSRTEETVLDNRGELVDALQTECNKMVYEYFELDEIERALVEDTVSITMESILPARASAKLPTLKESSSDLREQYTKVLCDTLNDWTRGGSYHITAQVESTSGTGMGVVVLDRSRNDNKYVRVKSDRTDGLLPVLSRLRETFKTDMGSIELLRGVKIFDQNSLYLFKALDQRFWTRTAAFNDADEIATTVLMRSRQERHG
jgi:hypothetical protein